MATFRTESSLVNVSIASLAAKTPFATKGITREFDYRRGRTDVVVVTQDGDVLAFEAKLERWRDALIQAYRNKSFAHLSFIIVPPTVASRAARYASEFDRRGVGICTIQNRKLVVVHAVERSEPWEPWLSATAAAAAAS